MLGEFDYVLDVLRSRERTLRPESAASRCTTTDSKYLCRIKRRRSRSLKDQIGIYRNTQFEVREGTEQAGKKFWWTVWFKNKQIESTAPEATYELATKACLDLIDQKLDRKKVSKEPTQEPPKGKTFGPRNSHEWKGW